MPEFKFSKAHPVFFFSLIIIAAFTETLVKKDEFPKLIYVVTVNKLVINHVECVVRD